MKKNIYSIILCSVSVFSMAQVAIEKNTVEGASTLLDFYYAPANTNGIIISAVDNKDNALGTTTSANNGTFLFDKSDNKLKMYEAGSWRTISETGEASAIVANTSAEAADEQGTIIGSDTSEAKGVLVLESSDKALYLPRVFKPAINVKSPYPGMMCYDYYSHSIAIFDGKVWNYLNLGKYYSQYTDPVTYP